MIGSAHFLSVVQAAKTLGKFNKAASKQMLMNFDEMSRKDGVEFNESLKTLITGTTIQIEAKGVDPVVESNHSRVWITTNNADVVQLAAGEESRRFVVHKASNKHCKDT
eukprot:4550-Heterococcus_DN1.PRE.1